ncbi:MAG TPA: autotransporter-associated beta strand repeat-containing protein, partial [Pirellulales bacterium]
MGTLTQNVGAVTLAGGNNTIEVNATAVGANPQLVLASLTRENSATLSVLASSLDAPIGVDSTTAAGVQRGDVIVANPANLLSALVGGGSNTPDTPNISILPWAVGQAQVNASATGNTFVTYNTSIGNGFLALNTTTEYEQLTPSGGTTLENNARYATSTGDNLVLTGTGHQVNSLLIDSTGSTNDIVLSGSGASDSLAVQSGAFLFTGPSGIKVDGFGGGITTTTGEYVFTANTTGAGNPVEISSNLTSAATITKSGPGVLELSGNNSNITGVTVDQGVLAVNAPAAVNGQPVYLDGGSLGLLWDGTGTGLGVGSQQTYVFPDITVNANNGGIEVGQLNDPSALNKTIEFNFSNISGLDNTTFTVTNNNGYGLELTGAYALPTDGPVNMDVLNATNSNVVQGLRVTGAISGGPTGAGVVTLTKSGAGAMILTNSGNTFGGGGSIIDITQGVLGASSDAALGDASNEIRLNPSAGTATFRATGTFATDRTIIFGTPAFTSAIEVISGDTLTLDSPFDTSLAPGNNLYKNDDGTLAFGSAVDNSNWTGIMTIDAGAVQLAGANNLGSAAIVATTTGGALQLTNDITLTNALTLDGTGIVSGGALESVSGNNTVSGLITLAGTTDFGADVGSTLNLTGGFSGTSTINFVGGGTINISGPALPATASMNIYNWTSSPSPTTLVLGVDATSFVGGLVAYGSAVQVGDGVTGAGALGGTGGITMINSTLTVNDNGSGGPIANRLGGTRAFALESSTLNYVVNSSSGSSEVTTNTLTVEYGMSQIIITNPNNQPFTLGFKSLSLGSGGALLDFQGTFGTPTQQIVFPTAPALLPAITGILANAIVGTPGGDGNGIDFATYGTNGITTFSGYTSGVDINDPSVTTTSTVQVISSQSLLNFGAQTVNALDFNAGAVTKLDALPAGGTTLTLTSGNVMVTNNTDATIGSGATLWFAGANSDLIVNDGSSLTVNGAISSSGYVSKELGGSLTFNAPQYFNTGASYFGVQGGTVTLNGGTDTLYEGYQGGIGGQYLQVDPGATLDLNGTAQMVGLLIGSSTGGISSVGGTVTSSPLGAGNQGTFVLSQDVSESVSVAITGNLYFARSGPNNYNTAFFSSNTYTGGTLLMGGVTTLEDLGTFANTSSVAVNYGSLAMTDNGNVAQANRINAAAPITLQGATLAYTGRAYTISAQSVGDVAVAQGLSTISVTTGSGTYSAADLTLASFTETGPAMVNFSGSNLGLIGNSPGIDISSFDAAPPLTNNILGAWATVNGTDFASYIPFSYDPANGVGVGGVGGLGTAGFPAYDGTAIPGASEPTANIKVSAGNVVLPSGGLTLNTLNWAATKATQVFTFANDSDMLNLAAGGLLKSGNYANAIGAYTGNGFITAGGSASSGTQDLYITNSSTSANSTLTINATIEDTSAALGSGTAKVELDLTNISTGTTYTGIISITGANTYTGGTIINGGTVTLDGSGITIPAGGLTVNNATVTMDTNAGQIDPSNVVTFNGSSTLTLAGNNSLDSL